MLPDFSIGPYILMYHSVDDNSEDLFSVSVEAFRQQMSWLSENGYEVVSLSFLLRSILSGNYRALRKKVVITFDDGTQDFITGALPILRDRAATATVFLVTGMLGMKTSWNGNGSDVPLMSEDQARYIKSQGISLGSHTSTHEKLPLLEGKMLERQLRDSYDSLICLGESFCSFAYPWGQWSPQVADAVRGAGYECAVAVGELTRLTAADAYCLPRITMTRDMDLKRFQSLLTRTRFELELRRRYRMLREKRSGAVANPQQT